jgi:TonB family protein
LTQQEVSAPVVLERSKPAYTPQALRAKVSGVVLVGCIVQTTGTCTDVRVTHPVDPGLDQEAIKAIQAWRFHPARRFGEPVPYFVTIEMVMQCEDCPPAEYETFRSSPRAHLNVEAHIPRPNPDPTMIQ